MTEAPTGTPSGTQSGTPSGTTSPRARRISRRIGSIAESATLKVDAKAKALKAEGRPVIGFGAGEPDFPTPAYVVEAAVEACRDPQNHRYTPAGGLPELRQAIADKTHRDSGYDVAAAQVVVTNGGKQAIYEAFATMLDPGDEVIVPAPYWTTYPEAIQLAGGVAVPVVADETQDYKVTVKQLEAARTDRTKVLLFVSPSNPTGAVYTADEVRAVGRWVADHELWVLTDEIYEHLVYDDVETGSLPVLCPELADSCVVVNGVAKTYAMTGWRVGWLIAPKDLAAAATNLQSHATSNVSNVAQRAALAAVTGDLSAVHEMKAAFDRRRRTIVSMLNEIEGVVCPTPEGAFYAYPSVKGLLGREHDGRLIESSAELAEYILEEAEVAVVPGEAFGTPGYMRLSYALGDDDLVEGITRLQKLFA
jgi:aspartate/methionine/tyrosine aminotransferase